MASSSLRAEPLALTEAKSGLIPMDRPIVVNLARAKLDGLVCFHVHLGSM